MRPPSSLHPVPGWGWGSYATAGPLPFSLPVLVGGCQMTSAARFGAVAMETGTGSCARPPSPSQSPFCLGYL